MTAILPEVVTPSETDVHQLLEQMARMRELLSTKEAELAEVKSELTFTRGEIETAREDADIARRQAETAREEVETVTSRMTVLERESHTVCLEVELDKLREMESLRREFDAEQRQLRQDCERDAREFKEWRKELTSERDHLRAYVEQLREELTDSGDHDGQGSVDKGVHDPVPAEPPVASPGAMTYASHDQRETSREVTAVT
jgi:chromosome segregation ATPase